MPRPFPSGQPRRTEASLLLPSLRRVARRRPTVFEPYYRELLSFLVRRVCDRSDAAELTQESYARVYAAQAAGTKVGDPRALLYRTARNLLIDLQRRRRLRAGVELEAEAGGAAEATGPAPWEPEAALASRQGVQALVETIEALPPRCREAFVLNRFEDLSYAQVAERMGISVKMVEQHMKLALDACERCRRSGAGEPDGALAPRRKLPRSRGG